MRGTLVPSGAVALLDNRFRNSVREQFPILPIARLAAFTAITQVTAFHQHGRTRRIAQDTKICRVDSTICRVGDRHEFFLDPAGNIEWHAGMIIRLESANGPLSRIVKMYADEDCVLL